VTVCLGTAAPVLADDTNVLSDEKARVSYALGMSMAQSLKSQGVELDGDLFARGARDQTSGGATLLTREEAQQILSTYQRELFAKREKLQAELAVTNKIISDAFMATNKDNPGVVTLPDGLQYLVITNGTGDFPAPSDTVTVNYRGTLLDGKEFDSSYRRGQPSRFAVAGVIRGWTEALTKMRVGSQWRVFVPPQLAYGERGVPGIPPSSVLIFDIDLLSTHHESTTSDIIKVPSAEELKKGAQPEIIKKEDVEKLQKQQSP